VAKQHSNTSSPFDIFFFLTAQVSQIIEEALFQPQAIKYWLWSSFYLDSEHSD
jgi:hypothetical protein